MATVLFKERNKGPSRFSLQTHKSVVVKLFCALPENDCELGFLFVERNGKQGCKMCVFYLEVFFSRSVFVFVIILNDFAVRSQPKIERENH